MDDSCAVCADSLEWVAYGACGHREVCSTCVVRLRFICGDKRCCICKTESPVIFITKALGDYTRMINDFAVFPSEPKEGRLKSYWYHEDSQAFFDDVDQYKMIKAMCRLSCSVCDKMEEVNDASKRRAKFKNIDQLKGHLFHRHRLLMCSLCLEGRKVFVCEQKLYTRVQLNQHVSTGDSDVDGSESDRGGFMGHPMCEFCKSPFYGDNELYTHMSTEHYTCHICQRQHPGQYEYYKNYDDLEIHFRREHFLCEDEACLGKKFVVFQSEAEMKRHNTLEHGGRMSRAKRNAALQIPTSFQFRRRTEQDYHRRGRGRARAAAFRQDQYDDQLSTAIQASLEEGTSHEPSSSNSQMVLDHGDPDDFDPLIQPFESLSTTDSERPSRYLKALGQSYRSTPLEESSFPPLLNASTSQQQNKQEAESLTNNTMAARLRGKKRDVKVLLPAQPSPSSAQAWPTPTRGNPSGIPGQSWPNVNASASIPRSSGYATSVQAQAQVRPASVQGHIPVSGNFSSNNRIMHSASAPTLSDSRQSKPSISDFPPVSSQQVRKTPPANPVVHNVEDVQMANKSLVEKIRASVDYDEEKYASFKDLSSQYRLGSIGTENYLYYVKQYGLSHLVLELARLCPDPQKQKELVDTYNASVRSNGLEDDRGKNIINKKKGKGIDGEGASSKDKSTDSVLSTRALQTQYNSPQEEVEVLTKDGYRGGTKGKGELSSLNVLTGNGSNQNTRDGGSGSSNKQKKKTSKFHRMRLGDGSMADFGNSDPDPDPDPNLGGSQSDGGLPVRGVWKKGGQNLFS